MTIKNKTLNAAFRGDLKELESLHENYPEIQLGNVVNDFGHTLLHFAANGGHADVVTFLVDAGVALNPETQAGDTPLNLAANGGHAQVGVILLENYASYANPAPAHNIVFNNAATGYWTTTTQDETHQYFVQCEGVGTGFHSSDFM